MQADRTIRLVLSEEDLPVVNEDRLESLVKGYPEWGAVHLKVSVQGVPAVASIEACMMTAVEEGCFVVVRQFDYVGDPDGEGIDDSIIMAIDVSIYQVTTLLAHVSTMFNYTNQALEELIAEKVRLGVGISTVDVRDRVAQIAAKHGDF